MATDYTGSTRPGGGTGIRGRLKPGCPSGHVGSSPTPGIARRGALVAHGEHDLPARVAGLAELVRPADLGQREDLRQLDPDLAAHDQLGNPAQLLRAGAHPEHVGAHPTLA